MALFLLSVIISLTKTLSLFLVACVAAVCGYIFYIVRNRSHYKDFPGPPMKSYFLGHATEWLGCTSNRHELLIKWGQEYGPLYKFMVAHKVMLIATTPDLAKQLLNNSREFPKSKQIYGMMYSLFGERYLGRGLATETDHTQWRLRRKALEPGFHKIFIENDLNQVFNNLALDLVGCLTDKADGKTLVDLEPNLRITTLRAIGQIAFSFDIQFIEAELSDFVSATDMAMKALSPYAQDPTFKYMPWNREFVKDVRRSTIYLRNVLRKELDRRIDLVVASMSGKNVDCNGNIEAVPNDMLTMMVTQWLNETHSKGVDKEELIDDMQTIFLAGHETTASTLAFILRILPSHPDVLQRILDEADAVLDKNDIVRPQDVPMLSYTDAAIKETLRMYSVAVYTFRDVKAGTMLSGYKIPSDTCVAVSFYPIQRLYTPKGDQFMPERFLPGHDELAPPSYGYLPFSKGQRSCIGMHFAYLEAKIILVTLLHHFQLEHDPKTYHFDLKEQTVFSPIGGVPCKLRPRSKHTHAQQFQE